MCKTNKNIMENKFMNQIVHKSLTGQFYKNIPIHTGPGLHEFMMEKINNFSIPKNSRILELGAGSGAFTQRLIDNGYENVISTDLDNTTFQAKNKFYKLNCNTNFSGTLSE